MMKLPFVALALAAVWATANSAWAGAITFTGNYAFNNGTGNGPIQGVLSLQQPNGQVDSEYGFSGWSTSSGIGGTLSGGPGAASYSWSSSPSQVHMDTTPSGYFAQSVGVLAQAGINQTNMALTFQVNVTGQNTTMTIRTFDVVFIHADGTLVGTLTYTPDGHSLAGTSIATQSDLIAHGTAQTTDNGVLPGVGQGTAGWLYNLNLATILAADPNFFTNDNNRVGMNVKQFSSGSTLNFQPVNDGSDNFYFTSTTQSIPVPLPAAAWSGMALMAALGVGARLRKRGQDA